MKHKFIQTRKIDKELRALYEVKGKMPDMKHLEHGRYHRTTRVLIGVVIVLGVLTVASWAGFFLFGTKLGGGGEVDIRINGPEIVVSGLPQQITVRYKNLDRHPLAFTNLRLRTPNNLLIQEIDPEPTNQEGRLEWDLGNLPAKETGEIHLKVIPYGVRDDQVELQAFFSYKPANFNAEFQTSTAHTFDIRASGISTRLEGPDQATPGQELDFKAWVRNDTDETFEKLRVLVAKSPTFTVEQTEPPLEENVWKIDRLESGQEQEFSFKGSFLSSAEGEQEITLLAEIKQAGKHYPLGQTVLHTQVTTGTLNTAELLINGKIGAQQWVRLGQPLTVTLRLAHQEDEPLEEVSAAMQIRGDLLDLTDLIANNGNIENGTITFPKTGKFTLQSGQTHEFEIHLGAVKTASNAALPITEIQAEITYNGSVVRTAPVKLIIASNMSIAAEARYFGADGNPVGSGPLPPRVGEETRFNLRFRLQNSFHDLSNIAVISKLPENVAWADKTNTQTGKLSYNPDNREIRWEIERLPITQTEASAQFEVSVTPNAENQSNLLLLLGVTRAQALDTISQINFSSDAPSVSSSLETDPLGKGKGVVE